MARCCRREIRDHIDRHSTVKSQQKSLTLMFALDASCLDEVHFKKVVFHFSVMDLPSSLETRVRSEARLEAPNAVFFLGGKEDERGINF